MRNKIKQIIFGRDIELAERLFRMVLIVGEAVSLIAVVECLFLVETVALVLPLLINAITMGIAMYVTLKHKKSDIAAIIVAIVLIVVVFPAMFFVCGGVNSGAMVWFALELVYVFMMFSGVKLFAFIMLCLGMDVFTYGMAYYHPEIVMPLESNGDVYMDSLFSTVAVGLAVGGLLKFEIKLFKMERTVVLSQNDELEKMSNSQNAFYANMSHEIRTPIHTIIGLNEMILRENPEGKTKEYAANIQVASKMLLNLVNDILDLSQVEMKKMEIIPVAYNTKEMVEELVDMIQIRMKEKELDLYVELDQNLPSVLVGDEKRIKQVLLNILTNAVKYTERGSVTLSAYGEPAGEDSIRLKIAVADTGIGIRKEDLESLYDIFKRVDEKRNSRVEGSGLGLSISKQFIDLMGGQINVDSIYTKGSTFTVTLEQQVVDPTPVGEINFLERNSGNVYQYKPAFEAPEGRILIVDDNAINVAMEEQLLKDTKLQIDVARSGPECLKQTKQRYYHVILMDYQMSEMTGAEVLKELRKQENGLCRDSYVLLMTAASTSDAKRIMEENGFDGFLEKPITGRQMEKELLKFLPKDIIEYQYTENSSEKNEHKMQRKYEHKKKKVYITTDCVCDLPQEYLDKYDIKVIYFYIKTKKGRFADTKEISSDNLMEYMEEENGIVSANSVSVEEYEEFFAEILTRAEHVVHISTAKYAGKSYEVAVTAAKGFDHVQVIDSGHISCGQGLVVLYAAKLMMEGCSREKIGAEIEKCAEQIGTCFIMPNIRFFYRNGYTDKVTAQLCNILGAHPVLTISQRKLVVTGIRIGNMENSWKRFIRCHLRNKNKICKDIIFITYVGCTVKQLELIKEEVLKCIPFEKVILQKSCFSTACNSGQLTIGLSYYKLK